MKSKKKPANPYKYRYWPVTEKLHRNFEVPKPEILSGFSQSSNHSLWGIVGLEIGVWVNCLEKPMLVPKPLLTTCCLTLIIDWRVVFITKAELLDQYFLFCLQSTGPGGETTTSHEPTDAAASSGMATHAAFLVCFSWSILGNPSSKGYFERLRRHFYVNCEKASQTTCDIDHTCALVSATNTTLLPETTNTTESKMDTLGSDSSIVNKNNVS